MPASALLDDIIATCVDPLQNLVQMQSTSLSNYGGLLVTDGASLCTAVLEQNNVTRNNSAEVTQVQNGMQVLQELHACMDARTTLPTLPIDGWPKRLLSFK